jgi:hypothetical protein
LGLRSGRRDKFYSLGSDFQTQDINYLIYICLLSTTIEKNYNLIWGLDLKRGLPDIS